MKIKCLQVGPIGTNCYLLCDEDAKTCAVIDSGGDGARIAAAVAETGCVPCAILLTHGHYDHTGAVGELQAKWPETPVYLNRRDVYADACTQQLFPLLSGDVRDYDEGDTVAVLAAALDFLCCFLGGIYRFLYGGLISMLDQIRHLNAHWDHQCNRNPKQCQLSGDPLPGMTPEANPCRIHYTSQRDQYEKSGISCHRDKIFLDINGTQNDQKIRAQVCQLLRDRRCGISRQKC